MARKLDARAATFSPSSGGAPPSSQQQQQQQRQQQLGTCAKSAVAERVLGRSNQTHWSPSPKVAQMNGRGGGGGSASSSISVSSRNRSRGTTASRQQEGGGERGSVGWVGGTRRLKAASAVDEIETDETVTSDHRNSSGSGAEGSTGGGGRGGRNRSSDSLSTPAVPASGSSGRGRGHGKGKGKGKSNGSSTKGGNANHLLNFQFQPISTAAHLGGGGGEGRARRGSGGGGGGSGRSKGGGVWGGGATRGPMSKEQFLQANFHFLLHNPAWMYRDASSTSPGLQEAFFNPDVLVDWDTVDTVRLFRKVSKRKQAALPPAGKVNATPGPESTPQAAAAATAASGGMSTPVSVAVPKEAPRNDIREEGRPAPLGFEGLSVLRAAQEISWGSGKKPASRTPSAAKSTVTAVRPDDDKSAVTSTSRTPSRIASPGGGAPDGGASPQDEVEGEEEAWRCPICLGAPIVPRSTKCGHGPFCFVCILRHLEGEASARCPLCFDKIERGQLRRVACQDVRTYTPGDKASLLLLRRERSSLVPVRDTASGGLGGTAGKETTSDVSGTPRAHISGGGIERGRVGAEGEWSAGICPREGDESARFSRLVRAELSTLRDLAGAEQAALLTFRHESIASGETEWVPYISQAQALVNAQSERFSSSSFSPGQAKAASSVNRGKSGAATAGGFRGGSATAGKPVGSGTPPRSNSVIGEKKPGRALPAAGGANAADANSSVGAPQRVGATSSPHGLQQDTHARVSTHASNGGGDHGAGACVVEAADAVEQCAGGNTSKTAVDEVDAHISAPGTPPTAATASVSVRAISGAGEFGAGGGGGGGPFRFFQSCDGQKAFLHPLDMRQLLDDAEKGLPLPQRIDAKVLEVETVKLTPELRRRLPFLGHLPIHCDISFVEVDMVGLVSEVTTQKFREETQKRERKRRGRAAQEARLARKEARLEQDRTDRIAAMRAFTVDLQGPTPAGAEPPELPPPPLLTIQGAASSQDSSGRAGNSVGTTVAAIGATATDVSRDVSSSNALSSGAGFGRCVPEEPAAGAAASRNIGGSSGADAGEGEAGWSFARVTAMNGHFPTLKPPAVKVGLDGGGGGGSASSVSISKAAAGARGRAVTAASTSIPVGRGGASAGGGVWGGRANGFSTAEPTREGRALAEGELGPAQTANVGASGCNSSAGKKKSRKGKAVSLFSNAGVRGGSR